MVLFTLGTNLMQRWTGAVGKVEADGWGGYDVVKENEVLVGDEGGQYAKAFGMSAVLCGVVVVWSADLFWRGVDVRAVRWARGVEM